MAPNSSVGRALEHAARRVAEQATDARRAAQFEQDAAARFAAYLAYKAAHPTYWSGRPSPWKDIQKVG